MKNIHNIKRNPNGFGIVEVIVAMGLFVIIATTAVVTVAGTFSTNRLGDEETHATLIAQKGLEAARSMKNQGWTTPFLGTSCTSGCGISLGSGVYSWLGTGNTAVQYTRVINVSDVERDGSGDIVTSGGTVDPNTKKITSTVTWNFTPSRSNTVAVSTYVTDWGIIATPTPTPTPTSCNEYAILQGYVSGTCRSNATQCTNNSEYHLSAGDTYCTGGPSADTCCGYIAGATPTPSNTPTLTPVPTSTPTLTPTPTSAVTSTPTPTPTVAITTCALYCQSLTYSGGTCRQNVSQCNNHGETHQSGGDVYCTGGPFADTCCCL